MMISSERGGYRVSASGELSLTDNSHNIFDKDISDSSLWTPSAYGYNSSTGAANSTGSITLTNGVQGHWVQLDLPHNSVMIMPSNIQHRVQPFKKKDYNYFSSNHKQENWQNSCKMTTFFPFFLRTKISS